MSEEETNKSTDAGVGGFMGQILNDPETQKAITDMLQPAMQMQENIFQTMIENENKILAANQVMIDALVEMKATLAVILSEVKK